MSVNLDIGGADVADVAAVAQRTGVDVIAFQEFTPEARARLDGADFAPFRYRSIHPRELALGSAIYSRVPMTDDGVRRHPSGFYQAQGTLTVAGAGAVRIESAHPCAPTGSARSGCWADDLADQPPARNGTAQILLGDFNATLDHSPLRNLLSSGYTDAAASLGHGLTPTWPYDRPVPKITIDHVLVNSRVSATTFAAYPIRGTDHHAIVADLMIRTG
jgi:endonuclease/exonuclease/phosphatase family metal-dependent hydrolase